jgi:addiction module HigA family antidote
MNRQLEPILPGEILLEEFLKPMAVSQNHLARAINVPAGRINEIIRGKRAITCDTAARLAVYFGLSADFWINLQARYDAKIATRKLMPRVAREVRPHKNTAA